MEKKHFVFVIGNYKNGGVPMHSTNLANEFSKKGYSSTILVTKETGKDIFFHREKNVNLVSLKEYYDSHISDKIVKKELLKRRKQIKIFKRLRYITKLFPKWDRKIAEKIHGLRKSEMLSAFAANHPDCIYIPFGISYFVETFYAVKKNKSKIIYAERNAPALEFPLDFNGKKQLFELLSKADGAVLQTKEELAFFENNLRNAKVIHNPIKADLPKPFYGERRKTVVNFCRIAQQKNLPLLIEAFIKFHETYPDYNLEIYSNTVEENEEELLNSYKELLSSLNAEDYIAFLPPRADVHEVVRDCTMFVSSSDYEGLSNSMIEAMAIGLPCVCTDCLGGGAREIITNGVNGLLVPTNNVQALTDAMIKMADDKTLSEKCSLNAVKLRTDLSVESIAEEWLNLIKNIQ